MEDLRIVLLAVTIDAPVALLHAIGIPGDLVVHQAMAVALQINALRGGIGGEQHPHRALLGRRLEGRLDPLALVVGHPAIQRQQAVALGQALGSEQRLQPLLGCPILGKDNHPLVRPLAAGREFLLKPGQQRACLAVGAARGLLGPVLHRGKPLLFSLCQRAKQRTRRLHRVAGSRLRDRIIAGHLIDAIDERPQDAHAGPTERAALAGTCRLDERALMLLQGGQKRRRRGEQTLLEQLEHKLSRGALDRIGLLLLAQRGVGLQLAMHLAFLIGVGDFKRMQFAARKARAAVPVGQFALEPAHHHLGERLAVGRNAPRKALVIKQFEQRRETLGIAIVRRGGQEQAMLEMRRQQADGGGALRIDRIAPDAGRRDIVGLIDNQQIKAPGIGHIALGRQRLAEQADRTVALEIIHRSNQTRKMRPGIDVQTATAAKPAHQLAIDNPKIETKLLAHLVAPLELQRRRADNQDAAGAMTNEQVLGDQAGLNRLAQADIIGNQQIDSRHLNRPHHRVKLIILDLDPAAKRRLERPHIRRRHRAPAHRTEKGIEAFGGIEAIRRRQGHPLMHLRIDLDFPDHLNFLTERIIVNRGKRHEVMRLSLLGGKRIGRQAALRDIRHHKATLAHIDQLPDLGKRRGCERHRHLRSTTQPWWAASSAAPDAGEIESQKAQAIIVNPIEALRG